MSKRRDLPEPVELLDLGTTGEGRDDLESYRPSLVKLTRDLRALREELKAGFPGRRDVLKWLQRLSVRTLGEVPQRYYREFSRQFRIQHLDDQGREGVLLAALLEPHARTRDLVELYRDDDGEIVLEGRRVDVDPAELEARIVERLRGLLGMQMIRPTHNRAFRQLRKDATEYADDAEEAGHDPTVQEHPAMRPSLGELDEWQATALEELLTGFDDVDEIERWGDVLEQATNGELNETEAGQELGGDFIQRCYRERSARAVLLGDQAAMRRGRELMAATYIIPAFNLGVREQLGRAAELPDVDQGPTEAKPV